MLGQFSKAKYSLSDPLSREASGEWSTDRAKVLASWWRLALPNGKGRDAWRVGSLK
jgi:hypothetical protein